MIRPRIETRGCALIEIMDRSKVKNATVFDKSLATRGKTEVRENCYGWGKIILLYR